MYPEPTSDEFSFTGYFEGKILREMNDFRREFNGQLPDEAGNKMIVFHCLLTTWRAVIFFRINAVSVTSSEIGYFESWTPGSCATLPGGFCIITNYCNGKTFSFFAKNQVVKKIIELRLLLDYLTIRLIHKVIHHSTWKNRTKNLEAKKKVLRKHKIDIDENEILFLPSIPSIHPYKNFRSYITYWLNGWYVL